jgi:rSAM/selenodomain-associated transferase 2
VLRRAFRRPNEYFAQGKESSRPDGLSAKRASERCRVSKLSIIIPVLNEGEGIAAALDALSDLRSLGSEIIVVDGGSRDATIQRARLRADRVISAPRGRAVQMNAGAAKASGDVLLFLHADTRLPTAAEHAILDGLERSGLSWGRFDVGIEGRNPLLLVVGWLMNLRSRLTGIATGDQAMFVRRQAFETVGRFAEIPLMEDIALSKRLKRVSRPLCIRERVITSGRRWEENGILATVMLMWRLRLAYFFGADPKELARRYEYE